MESIDSGFSNYPLRVDPPFYYIKGSDSRDLFYSNGYRFHCSPLGDSPGGICLTKLYYFRDIEDARHPEASAIPEKVLAALFSLKSGEACNIDSEGREMEQDSSGAWVLANPEAFPLGSQLYTEEEAFLEQIDADPFDMACRGVFADWLDEQNQPQKAALLRSSIQLCTFLETLVDPDSDVPDDWKRRTNPLNSGIELIRFHPRGRGRRRSFQVDTQMDEHAEEGDLLTSTGFFLCQDSRPGTMSAFGAQYKGSLLLKRLFEDGQTVREGDLVALILRI